MKIEDLGGAAIASSDQELEKALAKRYGQGVNQFWLTHEGREYPTLAILVNGDLCSLNYFPKPDDPGYVSCSQRNGLDPSGMSMFYLSVDEEQEVPNDTVVSFAEALAAAKEFRKSAQHPAAIDWTEL